MKRLLCINAGGIGDLHGLRARRLTEALAHDFNITYHDIDKSKSRFQNYLEIRTIIDSQTWDLIYQESTGIAGGLNLIRAAKKYNTPYIVSTGDPVGGFFHTVKGPLHGYSFSIYEKLLYRHAAGFVGWTPYLTGMALTLGAQRAITIEGAVDVHRFKPVTISQKRHLKAQFGLDPDHIVCGMVGSIKWVERQKYCYGLELVSMLPYLQRKDISLLIVGDGDGLTRLKSRVPETWKEQVIFTGRLTEQEVATALNAMDIGFITQTLDRLGNYRLTTKLPEYLASGLPIAMSPIPGFYDYVWPAGWALPPTHPASPEFHQQCALWLESLSYEEITKKAQLARSIAESRFDYQVVIPRFTAFIRELLQHPRS